MKQVNKLFTILALSLLFTSCLEEKEFDYKAIPGKGEIEVKTENTQYTELENKASFKLSLTDNVTFKSMSLDSTADKGTYLTKDFWKKTDAGLYQIGSSDLKVLKDKKLVVASVGDKTAGTLHYERYDGLKQTLKLSFEKVTLMKEVKLPALNNFDMYAKPKEKFKVHHLVNLNNISGKDTSAVKVSWYGKIIHSKWSKPATDKVLLAEKLNYNASFELDLTGRKIKGLDYAEGDSLAVIAKVSISGSSNWADNTVELEAQKIPIEDKYLDTEKKDVKIATGLTKEKGTGDVKVSEEKIKVFNLFTLKDFAFDLDSLKMSKSQVLKDSLQTSGIWLADGDLIYLYVGDNVKISTVSSSIKAKGSLRQLLELPYATGKDRKINMGTKGSTVAFQLRPTAQDTIVRYGTITTKGLIIENDTTSYASYEVRVVEGNLWPK